MGSTGLTVGYCLQALLDDPVYSEVIALQRKPVTTTHSKLKEVITAFDTTLEKTLSAIDAKDVFCCLWTTIKKAGSQEAFRNIDFSLVLRVAHFMTQQGAEQFIVISLLYLQWVGADKESQVFYKWKNRCRG